MGDGGCGTTLVSRFPLPTLPGRAGAAGVTAEGGWTVVVLGVVSKLFLPTLVADAG